MNHQIYIYNWLLIGVGPIQDGTHSYLTLDKEK